MNKREIADWAVVFGIIAISAIYSVHLWDQQTMEQTEQVSSTGACPGITAVEGDTVAQIALEHNLDLYEVWNANAGRRMEIIHPGDCIRLPNK